MVTIEPGVKKLVPLQLNKEIDSACDRQEDHRKAAEYNDQIPGRNGDDVRQHAGTPRVHNLKRYVGLFFHCSSPRRLHQDFTDQFPFEQMISQAHCPEDGYKDEVEKEKIKSNTPHQFDVVGKRRRFSYEQIFQHQQRDGNEIDWPEILDFVNQHVQNLVWLSQNHRGLDRDAVPRDESRKHEGTKGKPCDRHDASRPVGESDDNGAH
jgi:hypothetical protein